MYPYNIQMIQKHFVDRDESIQVNHSKYCLRLRVQSVLSIQMPKCKIRL